jgi:hypothetical protein
MERYRFKQATPPRGCHGATNAGQGTLSAT